jgi:hypothetical protein
MANFFVRPSGAGAIQGQPDEAAVVEGFVALGLAHGGDRRPPRHLRVEPRGEIAERVVAEARGNIQGAARERTSASMPAKAARRSNTPMIKPQSRAVAGMRPWVRPSPGHCK